VSIGVVCSVEYTKGAALLYSDADQVSAPFTPIVVPLLSLAGDEGFDHLSDDRHRRKIQWNGWSRWADMNRREREKNPENRGQNAWAVEVIANVGRSSGFD